MRLSKTLGRAHTDANAGEAAGAVDDHDCVELVEPEFCSGQKLFDGVISVAE